MTIVSQWKRQRLYVISFLPCDVVVTQEGGQHSGVAAELSQVTARGIWGRFCCLGLDLEVDLSFKLPVPGASAFTTLRSRLEALCRARSRGWNS